MPGAGMVADEAADLGLAGRHRIALKRNVHLAVIVAQVAVGGDRPQVDPLADVGVPEEALVVLVGEPLHDRGLDLAADPAIRSDRDGAADVGAEELGLGTDVAGPLDPGERLDPDIGADHDGPVRRVEDRVGIDPCGLVDPEQVGRAHQGQRRQLAVGHSVLASVPKIALDVRAVAGDEVPGPIHPLAADLVAGVTWRRSCRTRSRCHVGRASWRLRGRPRRRRAGRRRGRPEDRGCRVPRKSAGGTHRLLATITGPRASQSRSLRTMWGSRWRWTGTR